MHGENEELLDVARIGLDGLCREPPLAADMASPALDRLQRIGRGDDEGRVS
jgi:hypothetical protein